MGFRSFSTTGVSGVSSARTYGTPASVSSYGYGSRGVSTTASYSTLAAPAITKAAPVSYTSAAPVTMAASPAPVSYAKAAPVSYTTAAPVSTAPVTYSTAAPVTTVAAAPVTLAPTPVVTTPAAVPGVRNLLAMGKVVSERVISIEELAAVGRYENTNASLMVQETFPMYGAPYELTDGVVTLAPYFKIKDMDKFVSIWQEDYANFAHKEDCVHYAFCFSDDGRAHCREAYPNAEAVIQHLADVDVPLNAVLNGPADLERLEVHGPAAEIDKLREPLGAMGCLFYVTEWGNRVAKPAMDEDTVCHLYPYFQLQQPDVFKQIWYDAWPATKANQAAEKSHQYAFSFEDTANVASCRESYGDADGILLHLQNVDAPLNAVLNGPAQLLRLEVHAPASEIEKLRPALDPLGCEFFTTGWGFRNAVY